MIAWPYGLEKSKDGSMREIPVRHVWSSSLWITKDGTARRRYFNPLTQSWSWSETVTDHAFSSDGKQGLFLLDQWVPLATCISLAWIHRLPGSETRTSPYDAGPPHAETLKWVEMGSSDDERWDDDKDEVWRPLKWRIGIRHCPTSYQISSRARLKSPTGAVTSGFFAYDTMWASVRGAGLVDLLAAAKKKPNSPTLRPYQRLAVDAIVTGHPPSALSKDAGVKMSTAWSYFTQAAPYVPPSDLQRVGPNLVARDLWAVLFALQSEDDPVLGRSLLSLLPVVESRLPLNSEFRSNEFKMSELRLGRLCVLSTCSSLNNCAKVC